MPYPIPAGEPRSPELIRRHYELEKHLADRLRRASAAQRRSLYATVYDELFRSLEDHPQHRASPEESAAVAELQATLLAPFIREGGTFAEFGPGHPTLAMRLAGRFEKVYVVEASDVILGDLDGTGIEVVDPASVPLPIPDGAVDLCFSSHFIEHLHPDDAADHLAELQRMLRPGGISVTVTPNRIYGPHDVSRYFDDEPAGLHLREYSHRDLVRLYRSAGFSRVHRLVGVGEPPSLVSPRPAATLEALLTAVPGSVRRWVVTGLLGRGATEPFRPLEQVMVGAWR